MIIIYQKTYNFGTGFCSIDQLNLYSGDRTQDKIIANQAYKS